MLYFVARGSRWRMLAAFGDEPAAFGASPTFQLRPGGLRPKPRQRLHGQDGRRVHDFHLDGGDGDAFRAALASASFGYLLAALLLIGSSFLRWSFVLFPLWVLLLSIQILAGNLVRRAEV